MICPVKRQAAESLGPLFGPLYLLYLLLDDPKSWRYLPKWLSSFRPGRSLIGEAKPWIPYEAANWLEHYLNRNSKVFEWGSGGSTIFLSERAGQVFSVEHDKKWHSLVSKALAQREITNCSYELQEPKPIAGTFSALDESQSSRFIYDGYYLGMTVHEYVGAIDVHPDCTFDLVFVDGLVRTECIQHAIPKIKPSGYLMLDNSNNAEVAKIVREMQSYPHTVFHGIAPGWPPARWSNTVWQIS